jgi:hypothetical protein
MRITGLRYKAISKGGRIQAEAQPLPTIQLKSFTHFLDLEISFGRIEACTITYCDPLQFLSSRANFTHSSEIPHAVAPPSPVAGENGSEK